MKCLTHTKWEPSNYILHALNVAVTKQCYKSWNQGIWVEMQWGDFPIRTISHSCAVGAR